MVLQEYDDENVVIFNWNQRVKNHLESPIQHDIIISYIAPMGNHMGFELKDIRINRSNGLEIMSGRQARELTAAWVVLSVELGNEEMAFDRWTEKVVHPPVVLLGGFHL